MEPQPGGGGGGGVTGGGQLMEVWVAVVVEAVGTYTGGTRQT